MASNKPATPKGTRDFSPPEVARRNFIFDTLINVFRRYGFMPIETPAMEKLDTLMGKYGDEGDKLLFRILNSGPVLEKIRNSKSEIRNQDITEKGLRYDLTVPFARYVVQHQNDITFPFKRYQIQPVWRADRPQKGRYREFYQCDVDVIGSDSLLNEVELIQIIDDVFSGINLPVDININNRKILIGLAEKLGIKDKFNEWVIAVDKWDKIGWEGVAKELEEKSIETKFIKRIVDGDLNIYLKGNATAEKGFEEVNTILDYIETLKVQNVKFDPTLARGLDYYTGTIIEVRTRDFPGSICAGGRYDNLTGIFGLPGISGVGISFGADRIYDVLKERNLFPESAGATTTVLLVHLGEAERNYCIGIASQLRAAGINTEIYPDITKKISRQFDYANKKQIPYVIVVGEEEIKTGEFSLKNLHSGEQRKMKMKNIVRNIKTN